MSSTQHYTKNIVENLLRVYYSLEDYPDETFSDYYLDLVYGLKELKKQNATLYFTLIKVFINAMPIQACAADEGVTPRMINYRLNDGLELLTNIMNGDTDES